MTVVGLVTAAALAAATAPSPAALTVKATNKLDLARPSQTIELSGQDLAPLGEKDLRKIHVTEAGKELLAQAVDSDGDTNADQLIFQADFAPRESKTFKVTTGAVRHYKKEDFRAYGRFNRERFDDFVWENDRTAHRMYGKALETWQKEPLTSSTVDAWMKRTPRLVANEWYMVDNYHANTGEGADFYSAGPSRGVGGNGLWANDKLWVSKNFVQSRVLAQGPIRVLFELTYEPFDVAGASVAEVKRIRLDAGQSLNRFESHYKAAGPLTTAIGIKKGDVASKELSVSGGWLATWEPIKKGAEGHMGGAVIFDPKLHERQVEDDRNLLLVTKVPETGVAAYWAGTGWDRGGHFADFAAWKTYVDRFAQGVRSPIELTVSAQ